METTTRFTIGVSGVAAMLYAGAWMGKTEPLAGAIGFGLHASGHAHLMMAVSEATAE